MPIVRQDVVGSPHPAPMTYMQRSPQRSDSHSGFKETSGGFHMWLQHQMPPPPSPLLLLSLHAAARGGGILVYISFFSLSDPQIPQYIFFLLLRASAPEETSDMSEGNTAVNKSNDITCAGKLTCLGWRCAPPPKKKSSWVMLSSCWDLKGRKGVEKKKNRGGGGVIMMRKEGICWCHPWAGHPSPTDGNHVQSDLMGTLMGTLPPPPPSTRSTPQPTCPRTQTSVHV